jgi:hypothetical protein
MKTFWDQATREATLARIDRITGSSRPVWGKMTADRMLSHLAETMKMAIGELPCEPAKLPIPVHFFPLKQLIVYVVPIPRGAPTSPELLAGTDAPVDHLKGEMRELLAQFAARRDARDWPIHPVFGRLTPRAWGVLMAKHCDHHLRQFGV